MFPCKYIVIYMLYATKPLENPLKYGLRDTKMGVKAMVYWVLESYGLLPSNRVGGCPKLWVIRGYGFSQRWVMTELTVLLNPPCPTNALNLASKKLP